MKGISQCTGCREMIILQIASDRTSPTTLKDMTPDGIFFTNATTQGGVIGGDELIS